jgi:hypothetical protein
MRPHKTPEWILQTKSIRQTRERNATIIVALCILTISIAIVAIVAK